MLTNHLHFHELEHAIALDRVILLLEIDKTYFKDDMEIMVRKLVIVKLKEMRQAFMNQSNFHPIDTTVIEINASTI